MTFWQRKEAAQTLRALPLARVLAHCGACRDEDDKSKWHTARGIVSVTGAKFMNWSLGIGGGGAIDLAMHLRGLNFKGAVDWLAEDGLVVLPPAPRQTTVAVALQLPAPDSSHLGRVKAYLVAQRAIPLGLLEPLIDSGSLYADHRANAVFVLRSEQHLPVGAELRGTGPRCWRGLAAGSRKDQGFFRVPTQIRDQLVLCESAIDALSCRALHPEYGCLSTAGVRPNPAWLSRLLAQGREIYCGFDRDVAGEQMAQAMIALHPAVRRLRPEAHDWNDQLRASLGSWRPN